MSRALKLSQLAVSRAISAVQQCGLEVREVSIDQTTGVIRITTTATTDAAPNEPDLDPDVARDTAALLRAFKK